MEYNRIQNYKAMKKTHFILLTFLVMAVFSSCSSEKGGQEKQAEKMEKQNDTPNQWQVTDKQFQGAGMAVTVIRSDTFHYKVPANGYLDVPPSRKAEISSFMPGKVENISLLVGNRVKKGQVLLMLSNPDFLKLQQNYLKAKENLGYLKKEYQRQQTLAADSISSQKRLQQARTAYLNTLATFESLNETLKLLNIDLKAVENGRFFSRIPLLAPIDGYITRLEVTLGSHVNPSDLIMEIVNDTHVHLELKVFEKDVLKIKKGQKIQFTIPDMGNRIFSGTVHLIGKSIDNKSRTILVHGHLTGKHPDFVPGMYVTAKILTGTFTGLSVPTEAIIKEEENYFILRLLSHDKTGYHFEKVQVIPGLVKGEFTQVKGNRLLHAGDKILSKGAFFLM